VSAQITATVLAQALAAQQARPTTPTNQCTYGGITFVSPEAARAARAQQDDLEHRELQARPGRFL